MRKYIANFISLLFLITLMTTANAAGFSATQKITATPQYQKATKAKTQRLSLDVQYAQNQIIITNNSKRALPFNQLRVSFFSSQPINGVSSTPTIKWQLHHSGANLYLSHNPGIHYIVSADAKAQGVLKPQQTLTLALDSKTLSLDALRVQQVFADVPVKVLVSFTVGGGAAGGPYEVTIKNVSAYPIPLQSVALGFDYAGKIAAIWGTPWLDWKIATQTSSSFALVNQFAQTELAPEQSMTVQFDSQEGMAKPSNFSLKSVGGHPIGAGSLSIAMPSAPYSNAPTQTVSIKGMGMDQSTAIAWNGSTDLSNLVPGEYTITTPDLASGDNFYQSVTIPDPAEVVNKEFTKVTVTYSPVATGTAAVTLSGAPSQSEAVTFAGKQYTITRTVSSGTNVVLPVDSYAVSSHVLGYQTTVTPATLNITAGGSTNVTIAYKKGTDKKFGGYFESWKSSYAASGDQTKLANLPAYVNIVYLSFMKPDGTYQAGSYDISGTGLQFVYDGKVLKEAIAALKQKNPNTLVLIAVGGATYHGFDKLNTQAIADFVKDFGLDGVDIDLEPLNPNCQLGSDNLIHCATDQQFIDTIKVLRAALPRSQNQLLTIAAFSVGAYGEDQWVNAKPYSQYRGLFLAVARDAAAKDALDMVNIMSYDAGDITSTGYEPLQSLDAYQHYFGNNVLMGVEISPEAWPDPGHLLTIDEVNLDAKKVLEAGARGMMLWSIQKKPNGTISPTNPDSNLVGKAICQNFGLTECDKDLWQ